MGTSRSSIWIHTLLPVDITVMNMFMNIECSSTIMLRMYMCQGLANAVRREECGTESPDY